MRHGFRGIVVLSLTFVLAGQWARGAEPPAVKLVPAGTYATDVFLEGAAEIVAHDPATQRLFVVNGDIDAIDVLDARDPSAPAFLFFIDISTWGASPNSVAVHDGIVAVAVEASPVTDNGQAVFFDADGTFLGAVEVGALPDQLTFTPDGAKVLVANEGEPSGGIDPPGSISIIDLAGGPGAATVTTLGFDAFDARREEFRAKGVRMFPGVDPSTDFEPEYVAVSPDGTRAFAALEEANSFAVINLVTNTIVDIIPLGLKDHSSGAPILTTVDFGERPVLATTATVNPSDPLETTPGQEILLGGFSGLWCEGIDAGTGKYQFVTVPDRGPNGEPTNVDGDAALERPFGLPDYQARIVRFEYDPVGGDIELGESLLLTRSDGTTPITGLPNVPGLDEEPTDLFGNILTYDALGADLEGIAIDDDGTYWMCDEYRPAIYHFGTDGALIDRFVPEGTAAFAGEADGTFGTETLPSEYKMRRSNRGFEGIALDAAGDRLFGFVQSPLSNPNNAASTASDVLRIIQIDTTDGSADAEYLFFLEAPDHRLDIVDKVGDATWLGGDRFAVVVRDSSTAEAAKKFLYEVDLKGATNMLDPGTPALLPGKTLEQHTVDDLADLGIQGVATRKILNLPSVGYISGDKVEGLATLPDGGFAIINDNDFGVQALMIPGDGTIALNPTPTPVTLGILRFGGDYALDVSDRDDTVNIANWPVFGMFMPDALTSYEADGLAYYVSANEGDDRGETARVSSRTLDPDVFPDAVDLKMNANMGRLTISVNDGDIDGDLDYDRLQCYGARSFTIWDGFGNLVFDSGDRLEQIVAERDPAVFNSDNEANDSFDTRSDNKGPEPEAVELGQIGDRTYAFVGLERQSGIVTFDITDPHAPAAVDYTNYRDFDGDAEAGTAGDLGPEGIHFIAANESPYRSPLLAVANEVSGTTTLYRVLEAAQAMSVDRARVDFRPVQTRVTLAGEIELPAGVSFSALDTVATAFLEVGGETLVDRTTLDLDAGGAFGRHWTLAAPPGDGDGIKGLTLDWQRGPRFFLHGPELPFRLKDIDLAEDTAKLLLTVIPSRLDGPLTFDIDGRATLVMDKSMGPASLITASGDVTAVRVAGFIWQVTFDFPLLPANMITLSGSEDATIAVEDYLLPPVASFVLRYTEAAGRFPAGADTTPRTVRLFLELGAEGYPAAVTLNPDQLAPGAFTWVLED